MYNQRMPLHRKQNMSFRNNRFFRTPKCEKCDCVRNPIWFFIEKKLNRIPHKFSFVSLARSEKKILRNDVRIYVLMFFLCCNTSPLLAAEALSGDTIKLGNGRTLRLIGIKAASGAAGNQAKAHLQTILGDQEPVIEGGSLDRYGHIAANALIGSTWLQGEMLQSGMAFVYPPTGDEPRIEEMIKIEQTARAEKRGVWADSKDFVDLPANDPDMGLGHFAFVSGKVIKAERVKNMFYLNFGDNWRKDFTIAIQARDLIKWRRADIDMDEYEGKNVRVRGWIKRNFGPMIAVTHPAQIEVVGPAP